MDCFGKAGRSPRRNVGRCAGVVSPHRSFGGSRIRRVSPEGDRSAAFALARRCAQAEFAWAGTAD